MDRRHIAAIIMSGCQAYKRIRAQGGEEISPFYLSSLSIYTNQSAHTHFHCPASRPDQPSLESPTSIEQFTEQPRDAISRAQIHTHQSAVFTVYNK